MLHAAGAEEARLMIIAAGDVETIDTLVATAQPHFPDLELVVRANGMEHRMQLLNAGVKHEFHEMAGSALDAPDGGARIRNRAGTRRLGRHDLESAEQLAPVRHDEGT
jgi:glutathione-regulated potassium-efflux system ancillary protein KefC